MHRFAGCTGSPDAPVRASLSCMRDVRPSFLDTSAFDEMPIARRRLLAGAGRVAGLLAVLPLAARFAGGCDASLGGAAHAADAPPSVVTPEQERLLRESEFVYISSTRKDGTLSRKAEIWFTWQDGAVWVGTGPESWRAKRIRWKRPMATIWIGGPEGPSIRARGEFVSDPKRYDMLCTAYSAKYPARWPRWEASFREGLANGSRVLVRYVPVARDGTP